jgi:hypothetical protein
MNPQPFFRRAARQDASAERVDAGLDARTVFELGGRDDALVALALERVESIPMAAQFVRAEDEAVDPVAALVQDDARVAERRPPAFLEQRAPDRRGLPASRHLRQHVRVATAWGEAAVDEEPGGHGGLSRAMSVARTDRQAAGAEP